MVEIRAERPDHPQVRVLLAALDDYLGSLYAPEDNHILGVDELLAPGITFLAAWRDERVIGCGAVRRQPGYGEIKRMYVLPDARGQRVGERMLQALEASLVTDAVTLARLETGGEQHAAVRLYERCGYRRCAPFGGYPDNGLSLFYEKRLT